MNAFVQNILNVGVDASDSELNGRIKRYLNTALLISLVSLPYSVYGFINGGVNLENLGTIVLFLAALIALFCFYLQYKQKFRTASVLFLFGVSFLFTVISWAYGSVLLIEYYLLVGIIIAFILFNDAKVIANSYSILAIVCFVGLKIVFINCEPHYHFENQNFFIVANSAILVLSIFSSIWFYQKETKFFSSILLDRNTKLREAVDTKDKFMSIISHDLISPFAGIMGVIELLNQDESDLSDAEKKALLNSIELDSYQYFHLLENLLLWSQSQTNRIESKPERMVISDWISDLIPILLSKARDKEIEVSTSYSEGLEAWADKNMMSTILRNLLNNAIKFTPRKGRIAIECTRLNDIIEISVHDSGIGIPIEKQKVIFEGTHLKSSSGTENEKGTGLGLSICKEFAITLGGELTFESEPGNGSVFILTAPAYGNQRKIS